MAILVVAPGLLIAAVCAYYTLQDWGLSTKTYAAFERTAASSADIRAVFIAEARQNIYRINCFADGIGFLAGCLMSAIGITGIATVASRPLPDR